LIETALSLSVTPWQQNTGRTRHAAQDARLVADADLPQLDPGLEDGDEVPHQLAEIDAGLCGEEKQDLGFVQKVVGRHQLHGEVPVQDLALANPEARPPSPG
jgi:hypothetical protein